MPRAIGVAEFVQRIKFSLKRSACSTHSAAHGADLNKAIDNAQTQPRYLGRSNLEHTFTQLGSCTHTRGRYRGHRAVFEAIFNVVPRTQHAMPVVVL
jgi:hypothetical protein